MKKLVALTMAAIMSLGICTVGFAGEIDTTNDNAKVYHVEDGFDAILENTATGEIEKIKLQDCTLTVEKYEDDGKTGGTITAEGIFYVPESEETIKPKGDVGGGDYDKSGGVVAKINIHYFTRYDDSLTYEEQKQILVDKVSGSWTVKDSSISLSDRIVKMQCSCVSPTVNQVKTKNPTTNSFEYNTNFSEYIYANGYNAKAGADMTVTLKRGTSSTWTFKYNALANILNSSDISW